MKIVHFLFAISLLTVIAVPVAFGTGSCAQTITAEELINLDKKNKDFKLADGCNIFDPRCGR